MPLSLRIENKMLSVMFLIWDYSWLPGTFLTKPFFIGKDQFDTLQADVFFRKIFNFISINTRFLKTLYFFQVKMRKYLVGQ